MDDISKDEITFKDIVFEARKWVDFILSKYKYILAVAIISAGLGLCYSLSKKEIYIADLTFALEEDGGSVFGAGVGLAGQLGFDMGGGEGVFSGPNLIQLFKSRSMIEKTLLSPVQIDGKTISLAEMYIRDNNWRKGWQKNSKLKNISFLPNSNRENFSRIQDSILGTIYNNLSASNVDVLQKDKKVGILTIEVKSPNEKFSKIFAETLVDVVSHFYIETKSEKSMINMTILQKQLDSIRGELNGSISGVALANDRTFALNPALNVKRVPSVRRQVDVQANTNILTELIKQTELAKVTLRKETPLIQIIDRPIYPLKKERFGKAKGIIYGGFVGGVLAVAYFVLRRIVKILLK